ncbi:ABC transporter ATP-binding protein [Asticcacaulis sp. 201]|uniref:ABC transporter ATP-binding protein n=1 Tax=Asticcacaulis sp. 201 TaxID=3028787 RepID=UPI002916B769|nr:ATP-binding cassette domain-containing protein [Asticcacaulis sp. 201]MDV6331040.1 ATP-binding cassette domain-containing protein [Asticcacaulis sp. 201]
MTIELRSVTCYLPVYSVSAKSLRRTASSLVGGTLFKSSNDIVNVRALEDIDLIANDGDRIGLIGHNGAGKSTLLKVMAGVLAPSSGLVNVRGEISAALNTTLGLDMELSGRENIFLLSYYRGITKKEVLANIDEIIAAADIGHFIELPVYTYSSGMLGRLTFAVATSYRPDVVLMDEWLLAGDINFLAKAIERTTEYVKRSRVLVLASHSLGIIQQICNKAIYMKKGRIVAAGAAADMVKLYEQDPDIIAGHFVPEGEQGATQ